jgi:hypothetical protein
MIVDYLHCVYNCDIFVALRLDAKKLFEIYDFSSIEAVQRSASPPRMPLL